MTLMELIDAYAEAHGADMGNVPKTNKARTAVVKAVENLDRDAARYRWLLTANHAIGIYERAYGGDCWRVQDIDAAIDKAMEATNGQGN